RRPQSGRSPGHDARTAGQRERHRLARYRQLAGGPGMKKLYFIRHGLSVMNRQGVFSGSIDTPLTDEGRKQAKRAGKLARDFGIDYIVSSPLARALETAQIIAGEIG